MIDHFCSVKYFVILLLLLQVDRGFSLTSPISNQTRRKLFLFKPRTLQVSHNQYISATVLPFSGDPTPTPESTSEGRRRILDIWEVSSKVGGFLFSFPHLIGPINLLCASCAALAITTNITVPMLLQRAAIGWTGIFLGSVMMLPNAMMSDSGTFEAVTAASTGLISSVSLVLGGLYGCLINNKWASLLPGITSQISAVLIVPYISLLIKKTGHLLGLQVSYRGMAPFVVASFISSLLSISLGYSIDRSAWYIGLMTLMVSVLHGRF